MAWAGLGVALAGIGLGIALAPVPAPAQPGPRPLAPAQATATETEEPTEVPPTPVPITETPPAGACVRGLPSPRFQWTLYVTPQAGMWVPRGKNAGPYLKAHVMAKYGQEWYAATLYQDGRMVPARFPAWPRPDLIQTAASGLQTTRFGGTACLREPIAAVPPCFTQVVVPLVFLDRLAEDGPYLTRTYFWVPANQLTKDAGGQPSQLFGAAFDETECDTRQIPPRGGSGLPVYGTFNGCGSDSTRLDTCYAVGCGERTLAKCP